LISGGLVSIMLELKSAEDSLAQPGYRQALASCLLALEQLREAVGTRALP